MRGKFAAIAIDKIHHSVGAGHTPPVWLPLGGKLSPQVTDEGLPTGSFPLIRRVPRHLPPWGKAFPAGDEVAPPYIAILPQSFLPRPYPINVRARRALRIYYLLSFIYYLFCPAGALSSPMVHRSAASREIAIKNSLTFSVRLFLVHHRGLEPRTH